MKVDLSKYETVKERKKRFYKDHPDGKIIVELLNMEKIEDYALFQATIYFDTDNFLKNCPRATGYALEIRDKEKKTSRSGAEYESVNFTSWTENCEESAIGRALDNAGYSGNDKCSQEEIVKSNKHNEQFNKPKDDNRKGDFAKFEKTIKGIATVETLKTVKMAIQRREWTSAEKTKINELITKKEFELDYKE